MARLAGLREIRERRLGWEVTELAARMPDARPSISSIIVLSKLECRAPRVFDVVDDALGKTLDATKELVVS